MIGVCEREKNTQRYIRKLRKCRLQGSRMRELMTHRLLNLRKNWSISPDAIFKYWYQLRLFAHIGISLYSSVSSPAKWTDLFLEYFLMWLAKSSLQTQLEMVQYLTQQEARLERADRPLTAKHSEDGRSHMECTGRRLRIWNPGLSPMTFSPQLFRSMTLLCCLYFIVSVQFLCWWCCHPMLFKCLYLVH